MNTEADGGDDDDIWIFFFTLHIRLALKTVDIFDKLLIRNVK